MRIWTCEACHGTACEVASEDEERPPIHCPYDRIPRFRLGGGPQTEEGL